MLEIFQNISSLLIFRATIKPPASTRLETFPVRFVFAAMVAKKIRVFVVGRERFGTWSLVQEIVILSKIIFDSLDI